MKVPCLCNDMNTWLKTRHGKCNGKLKHAKLNFLREIWTNLNQWVSCILHLLTFMSSNHRLDNHCNVECVRHVKQVENETEHNVIDDRIKNNTCLQSPKVPVMHTSCRIHVFRLTIHDPPCHSPHRFPRDFPHSINCFTACR